MMTVLTVFDCGIVVIIYCYCCIIVSQYGQWLYCVIDPMCVCVVVAPLCAIIIIWPAMCVCVANVLLCGYCNDYLCEPACVCGQWPSQCVLLMTLCVCIDNYYYYCVCVIDSIVIVEGYCVWNYGSIVWPNW